MRVAIVGFGVEGRSAFTYWQKLGAEITVCDKNPHLQIPAGAHSKLGANYLHDLQGFDLIVRSAGLHPQLILEQNPEAADKITTVIDEFLQASPSRNIIGITGTKGKGTTSTLTALMLEAMGKQVFLGGNIGNSPLDFLEEMTAESWVVLELSSFQLIDVQHSPHIAVCLMVVPEHLNWHEDMDEYLVAKANLFVHQRPSDTAIYFADNTLSHTIASNSPGAKITYFAPPGAYIEHGAITIDDQELCKLSELKLLGQHNWQNACAAATVAWQVEQSPDAIRNVLTTFAGLPHRLEFVRELEGISYYDDSFGTTPETAIVAIEAFKQPKVVILGGASKGVAYDQLAKAVADNNVRCAVVIGDTAPSIAAALQKHNFTTIVPGGHTMEEIVRTARREARSGDVVLLSTGCASFGLFGNYKERGNQFKATVLGLK